MKDSSFAFFINDFISKPISVNIIKRIFFRLLPFVTTADIREFLPFIGFYIYISTMSAKNFMKGSFISYIML